MSSAASRVGQKFRESVGLASTTVDPDLVKALQNLKELESDVVLLRKVLETTNKMMNRSLPEARTQTVKLIGSLGAKIIIRPDETEAYTSLLEVHETLDVALATKFGDVSDWLAVETGRGLVVITCRPHPPQHRHSKRSSFP